MDQAEPCTLHGAPAPDLALLEAILFVEGVRLSYACLARKLGLSEQAVDECVARLGEALASGARGGGGLELHCNEQGVALLPAATVRERLATLYGKRSEGRLSRAAMETLSIVAYAQPVTRAEIEAIRGVGADTMIRLLSERRLICEVGKKDIPGKPAQYGTTEEFLTAFRLRSIADLPKLDEEEQRRFELTR
ncbi:SMC-Scp complex subunit ScpB [Treponema pallidum]|uniref:Transcriptional regulator n=2 Tax=Treponema pallidum TaxID=160 RepID=A0AAU8S0Y1_TREPL|nr:SMC-Scp complex subunit ScpB [Treponema pallidum]AEZ57582.1 putative transcriptional regulator [Treponema pallidum subsp. pertenue str. SamoaD]AEZ58651.1 putative transcriptional regulator [Treponema pallidum subsp. pertenue str. CDC2]AEZ59719.1 putative transcriptional regulator [Treponema pallidum subsp. pertenue str. Gauthier]AGK84104.1 putative transcriptional regulator [Treponema pallidum str. Fribourg-Blanc]AJB40479.1 putative transcriptional regulator [Treponema pallidum subsp. endem